MKKSFNNKYRYFILLIVLFACAGCMFSYDPCENEDNWEEECFYRTEKNDNYGDGTIFGKDKTITVEYCYRYCADF